MVLYQKEAVQFECCQNRDLGARLGYFSLFLPRLASISGPIEINLGVSTENCYTVLPV